MKTTKLAAVLIAALALAGCAGTPEVPATNSPSTAPTPTEETPATEGMLEHPVPWGTPYTVTVDGEPAWTITVGEPTDQTAQIVADESFAGWEEDYPQGEYVHYVTNVAVTRDAPTPGAPGEELTPSLIVDGIEEGHSPITVAGEPRWAFLDKMHEGATIEYPLVFTVEPGEISDIVVDVRGGGGPRVYFGN